MFYPMSHTLYRNLGSVEEIVSWLLLHWVPSYSPLLLMLASLVVLEEFLLSLERNELACNAFSARILWDWLSF